jgi:hypothetical protein
MSPQRDRDVAKMEFVPGSYHPAKLVVLLRGHPKLERALLKPASGAVLVLDLSRDTMMEIYGEIRRVAGEQGWPLPQ